MSSRLRHVALRLGFLDGPEMGYTHEFRWRFDFWNGSHSWLAFRYLGRNGIAAYRARYLA